MAYQYKKQDFLIQHIKRHPYWYASLCAHILIFLCLYYYFIILDQMQNNYVHTQEQYSQISQSTEKTTAAAMQQQFKNLQKIKKLFDESTGKQTTEKTQELEKSPETPEDILAESKKLAESIQAAEQQVKAEELAKILHIPEEEALKKIQSEASKAVQQKYTKADNPELALKHLEEQARDALADRKKQLEYTTNGTPVTTTPKEASDIVQQNNSNEGQKKESGAGGRESTSPHNNTAEGGNGTSGSEIRAKISQFLRDEIPLPEVVSGNNFSTGANGTGSVPDLFEGHLYKASGLTVGKDGDASNRFFINTWYLIGPFAGNPNRVYADNPHYPPEKAIVLDAVYEGKKNRLLRWEYITSNKYPLIPSIREEDSVYYGYTEIKVDEERDIWAWIGADDHVQLWLNNQVAYPGNPTNKWWFFNRVYGDQRSLISTWNLTETKQLLHFRKGTNKLLFKLSNGPEHVFFSMILTGR